MTKRHGNTYSFVEHFDFPTLCILTEKYLPRLIVDIKNELTIGIKDYYFLKEHIVVIRYGYFDAPFLLHNYPSLVLIALKMAK